jgi:hypothetical protein
MDRVQHFEAQFLPQCAKLRIDLPARFPTCNVNDFSISIGGATEYQGHNLGVKILLPGAQAEEVDSVALIIGLKHVTTSPQISCAAMERGAGASPDVSLALVNESIPYNEDSIADVQREFPNLAQILENPVTAWFKRLSD